MSGRKITGKVVGSTYNLSIPPPTLQECDLLEVRLDALTDPLEKIDHVTSYLETCPQDILITARVAKEGGSKNYTHSERENLLLAYCAHADYLDIELRSLTSMPTLHGKLPSMAAQWILSYHDFTKTPNTDELESLLNDARLFGPDIIKFAFQIKTLSDIERCQALLYQHTDLSISIMGMGPYAPVSRLLLAQSGSVLNYGYLGSQPTAPGQWSASLLKEALGQCEPLSLFCER